MKQIKIDLANPKKQEIGLIVDFLKTGKTIVYPTDTIYGLGCLATDKKAISRVYRIKKREKRKPFLVLISDFQMLDNFFIVDKKQRAYLKRIWPGRISAVLLKNSRLPKVLSAGLPGLAVRLPKSRFLTKLIKELGAPIVSTSFNLSGQPPLTVVGEISRYFKDAKPDLVVDAGLRNGKPSKLIDLTDVNNIKILRK
jgi:tRNA threonylcarbamoyl adenosine modification protein (Sua5/YciO/YrdC/YwlC family)